MGSVRGGIANARRRAQVEEMASTDVVLQAVGVREEQRQALEQCAALPTAQSLAQLTDTSLQQAQLPLGPRRKVGALRQAASEGMFTSLPVSHAQRNWTYSKRKQARLDKSSNGTACIGQPLPAHLQVAHEKKAARSTAQTCITPATARERELQHVCCNVPMKEEREAELLHAHDADLDDEPGIVGADLWCLASGRQYFDVRRAEVALIESVAEDAPVSSVNRSENTQVNSISDHIDIG